MSASKNYDLVASLVIFQPNQTYLKEALESIMRTPLKIKLAIYDNSPKKTDLSEWENKGASHFWNGQNKGFGAGHNYNLKEWGSHADYFLILNPDVYFENSLLPQMIERFQKDNALGLAIPQVCYPNGQRQDVNRRLPRPMDYVLNFVNAKWKLGWITESHRRFHLQDLDKTSPYSCPVISGCFMFFRTRVLLKVGGFDPRFFLYFEDTDISRRAAQLAGSVVFPELTVFHHLGRGHYQNPRLFLFFLRSLVLYFNKWGWVCDNERESLNKLAGRYDSPVGSK